jgi:hypothetical protein
MLGAAQPVGSTILEFDWAADMDSFATPPMLLPRTGHFKHAQDNSE